VMPAVVGDCGRLLLLLLLLFSPLRARERALHTHLGTHADANTRVRAPAARHRFGSGFSSSFNFFLFFPFYPTEHYYYYFRCFSARPSVRPSPTRPRRGRRPPTINARAVRGLRAVEPADHRAVPVTVPVRRLAACGHIIIIIFLIIITAFE